MDKITLLFSKLNADINRKNVFLFSGFLVVIFANFTGKIAADTLFLNHSPAQWLSYSYLFIAVGSILFSFLYLRLITKIKINVLCFRLHLAAAALILITRLLIFFNVPGIYLVILILYNSFNTILIMNYWDFVNYLLDAREAKKSIGFIGSAGGLGTILIGFSIKPLVKLMGPENLIFLYAFLIIGLLVVIKITWDKEKNQLTLSDKTGVKKGKSKTYMKFSDLHHLKYMVIISSTIIIVSSIIDYQFKVTTAAHLNGAQLASFFGSFYAVTGLISYLFQILFCSRIITRFGLIPSLAILPVSLVIGSILVIVTSGQMQAVHLSFFAAAPGFLSIVLARGMEGIFSGTIYNNANQIAYVPIPDKLRSKAKAFIDGVMKNLSKIGAAILMIALFSLLKLDQVTGSFISLALLSVTLVCIVLMKKEYLKTVLATLKTSKIDFENIQEAGEKAIQDQLVSEIYSRNEQNILYAVRILCEIENFDFRPYIDFLLNHENINVRAAAIALLPLLKGDDYKQKLYGLLNDNESRIRAAVILSLCSYSDPDDIERLTLFLESGDTAVRGAALHGIIKYYGMDGLFIAGNTLSRMLSSRDEKLRKQTIQIIGEVGSTTFFHPILKMLNDEDKDVQMCAIEACGKIKAAPLVMPLLAKLSDKSSREIVTGVLSKFDAHDLIPCINSYFEKSDVEDSIKANLVKILELTATEDSFYMLFEKYKTAGYVIKSRILESLNNLKKQNRIVTINHAKIDRYLEGEIAGFYFLTECITAMSVETAAAVLTSSLKEIRFTVLNRIFSLLGLKLNGRVVNNIKRNLDSDDRKKRANASEALDNLLKGKIRTELNTIMDILLSTENKTPRGFETGLPVYRLLSGLYDMGFCWINTVFDYYYYSRNSSFVPVKFKDDFEIFFSTVRFNVNEDSVLSSYYKTTILKPIKLFSSLPYDELLLIADSVEEIIMPAGCYVFKQGDDGDSLFIIVKGAVEVRVYNAVLATLGNGECFGEMAVLDREKRSASVYTKEQSVLYKLDRDKFYSVLSDNFEIVESLLKVLSATMRRLLSRFDNTCETLAEPQPDQKKLIADPETPNGQIKNLFILKEILLFSNMPEKSLMAIAGLMEEQEYRKDEIIFNEGDEGDSLFAIYKGEVSIIKGNKPIDRLKEKEYFGEMALLDNETRSAKVIAYTDCTLLRLPRDEFYDLMREHPYITKELISSLVTRLRKASMN